MHYVGMAAMQMEGEIKYRPDIFALSILIGVIASGAAMWIMNFVSKAKSHQELFHIDIASADTKAIFDKYRMIQIAVNIFSNAIKSSPENSAILYATGGNAADFWGR